MKLNCKPNKFITIPPISKEVWDHLQSFPPTTLVVSESFLRSKRKKDEVQRTFQLMMQEIYDISSSKPIHVQIGI